jgi:hypothetical protein
MNFWVSKDLFFGLIMWFQNPKTHGGYKKPKTHGTHQNPGAWQNQKPHIVVKP